MRYGDLVVTTAIYRSQCACDVTIELARGDECPSCPKCEAPVEWAYQRSTYKPVCVPGSDQDPTSERPPIRITAP
jgi:hypothetical protein